MGLAVQRANLATIELSTDGGTSWTPAGAPTSGVVGSWQVHDVTLLSSAYAVPNFRMRFHFTSDAFNNYQGWSVDDISIQGTTIDSCNPTVDSPNAPPCECTGTNSSSAQVTVACAQTICVTDFHQYTCSASGWIGIGQPCQGGGVCQCTGTNSSGTQVTVDCGQSLCGTDLHQWTCSASGWAGPGQSCQGGSVCQCTGTNSSSTQVTVDCGQSLCGTDFHQWACGTAGWTGPGQVCAGGGI